MKDIVVQPGHFLWDDSSPDIRLIYGMNARNSLRMLDERSVHLVVASPPHWVSGKQPYVLGSEPDVGAYVENLTEILREVPRVLRRDGFLVLHLVDTHRDAKQKDIAGVPWRVALALQDEGWMVRDVLTAGRPQECIFVLALSGRPNFGKNVVIEVEMGSPLWTEPLVKRLIKAGTAAHTKDARHVVLDPFSGVGMTGAVAVGLDRDYIGLDLSEKQLQMAVARVTGWGSTATDEPVAAGSILDIFGEDA